MEGATRMSTAWAQITKCDESDMPELLHRVGIATSLIKITKLSILRLDVNHRLFLKWENPVTKAFSNINFIDHNISNLQKTISRDVITSLEYCDHELHRHSTESPIDHEELNKFAAEIKTLIDEVYESELPDYLKNYLLDKLDLLLRAIEMYMFTGIHSLETAIESVVGSAVRNPNQQKELLKDNLGEKFWNTCNRLAILIKICESGIKLLDHFFPDNNFLN